MICHRAICSREFHPKRRHQKYCSAYCRRKAFDDRVPLRRVRRRADGTSSRRKSVVRRFKSVDGIPVAYRTRQAPLQADSGFTWQAPPASLKGALTEMALRSPDAMLRLAAAIREDAEARPCCRGCRFACADGEPCRILGANALAPNNNP
ncbi:MAG TPA: hypothetical protein VFC10_07360 [Terriglobia bacterium]|jgi:hypothetical protein|nr:hypothetical protein [Terriglobia bacterium]